MLNHLFCSSSIKKERPLAQSVTVNRVTLHLRRFHFSS